MIGEDMRITMLSASLSREGGGVQAAVLGAARSLSDAGATVSLAGLEDAFSREDWPTDPRIAAVTVPLRHRLPLRCPAALLEAVLAQEPDVLHLHGLWLPPSLVMVAWRKRTQRPSLISPHGMLDPWALSNSAWKKRLAGLAFERVNLAGASCLHALNDAEAKAARAYGVTGPIAVIPNGVALPDLGSAATHAAGTADAADGRKVVLFLGRIHPKKGLAETIVAWSRLDPALRDAWRLVIAGWDDGGHLAPLQDLATRLLASGDVHFAGPLFGAAKEAALRGASAFILASHSEGLPVAVLEAWSHACPVFMSAACNLPEGVAAGAAIEVTPDGDALARALDTHLRRTDLATIGERGRRLVERRFSWPAVTRRQMAVYRWLLDGGAPPADVLPDLDHLSPRRRAQPARSL